MKAWSIFQVLRDIPLSFLKENWWYSYRAVGTNSLKNRCERQVLRDECMMVELWMSVRALHVSIKHLTKPVGRSWATSSQALPLLCNPSKWHPTYPQEVWERSGRAPCCVLPMWGMACEDELRNWASLEHAGSSACSTYTKYFLR